MADTIQELQIKLKTTVDNSKGVGTLATTIDKLADKLQKLNGLEKNAKTLLQVSTALKGLSSVQAPSIGGFATQLKKISESTQGLDSKRVKSFADACVELYSALKPLADMNNITIFRDLNGKVNVSEVEKAVSDIGKTNEIDKTAADVKGTTKSLTDTSSMLSIIKNDMGDVAEFWKGKFSTATSFVNGCLNETKNAFSYLKSSIDNSSFLNGIKSAAERLEPAFEKIGSIGKSAIGGLSKTFDKIKGSAVSLAKTIGSKLSNAFKNLAKHSISSSGALGKIVSAFKRIVFYRAIRSVIKGIGDAFKEGVQSVYQWADAVGNNFAPAMDSIKTSTTYLKNSLGAMASTILVQLAEPLSKLVDILVNVINKMNEFIATLSGSSTYTKAIKVQQDYGDTISSNTKKAKEFQNVIMGFDEVNVLSQGKSGSDSTDYSGMFESVSAETSSLSSSIRDAIEKGDWESVGSLLAEKINGMVDNFDAEGLGTKLGKKIQSGIDFAYGFVNKIDTRNIGKKLAQFLNKTVEQIDTKKLGSTISTAIRKALQFVSGFLKEMDFEQIGKKIADFINGIDFEGLLVDLAETIGSAIAAVLDSATGFMEGVDWQKLGEELCDGIIGAIGSLSAEDENGKTIGSKLWEFLGACIGAVGGLGSGILKAYRENLAVACGLEKEADWTSILKSVGEYLTEGLFEGMLNPFNDESWLFNYIYDNVTEPLLDGFCEAFGIHSPSTVMRDEVGKYIAEGLFEGIFDIKGKWETLVKWYNEKVKPKIDKVKTFFSDTGKKIGNAFSTAAETVTNAWNTAKTAVGNTWNSMITSAKNFANSIIDKIEGLVNQVLYGLNSLIVKINNKMAEIPQWVKDNTALGEFHIDQVGYVSIPRLANGGTVDAGQLFIANEKAPELVGNFGGKSGAVPSDDVERAVQNGVYNAIMSTSNQGGTTVVLNVDGRKLGQVAIDNINSIIKQTGKTPIKSY